MIHLDDRQVTLTLTALVLLHIFLKSVQFNLAVSKHFLFFVLLVAADKTALGTADALLLLGELHNFLGQQGTSGYALLAADLRDATSAASCLSL